MSTMSERRYAFPTFLLLYRAFPATSRVRLRRTKNKVGYSGWEQCIHPELLKHYLRHQFVIFTLAQRLTVQTKHLRCSPRYQRRDGKHTGRVDLAADGQTGGDEPASLSFPV